MQIDMFVDAFRDRYNLVFGVMAGILATVLGEFWFLFLGFFVLNVVDFLTGWAKSRFKKEESSGKGAFGIAKKVGYWVVIGLSFFISVSCIELGTMIGTDLSFLGLMGYFTLATYLINELRSILENLLVLGVKIPSPLVKGLEISQKLLDERTGKGGGDR